LPARLSGWLSPTRTARPHSGSASSRPAAAATRSEPHPRTGRTRPAPRPPSLGGRGAGRFVRRQMSRPAHQVIRGSRREEEDPMCTRVLWQDAVVVGRNMDFAHDLLTNLWKMPRGVRRDDGVTGKLSWESKYGSVIAAGYDIASTDGLNEKGLAGHLLWLAESEYGDRDDARVQLSQAVWLQYFLDNFATVADAVRWVRDNDVQVVPLADPTGGKQPALHVALEDATGDA